MTIITEREIRKRFQASAKTRRYIAAKKEELRDPEPDAVARLAAERGVSEKVAKAILQDPTDGMLAVIEKNEGCTQLEAQAYWFCPADAVVVRRLQPIGMPATLPVATIREMQTDIDMQRERPVEFLDIHSRLHADEVKATEARCRRDEEADREAAKNGKWTVFSYKCGSRDDEMQFEVEYRDGVRLPPNEEMN